MPDITIDDLPDDVCATLASLAEHAGLSLEEYVLREIIRVAATETNTDVTRPGLSIQQILDARDADRR